MKNLRSNLVERADVIGEDGTQLEIMLKSCKRNNPQSVLTVVLFGAHLQSCRDGTLDHTRISLGSSRHCWVVA